jgi:hypothetical protein
MLSALAQINSNLINYHSFTPGFMYLYCFVTMKRLARQVPRFASLRTNVLRYYTKKPTIVKHRTIHDLNLEGIRGTIREINNKSIFQFERQPITALIICKIKNRDSLRAMSDIAKYLIEDCQMKVIIEEHVLLGIQYEPIFNEHKEHFFVFHAARANMEEVIKKTDVIICAGGDGTILYLHSLVSNFSYIPPILTFSIHGSLGFLLPHDVKDYKTAISSVLNNEATATSRMRLECNVERQGANICSK